MFCFLYLYLLSLSLRFCLNYLILWPEINLFSTKLVYRSPEGQVKKKLFPDDSFSKSDLNCFLPSEYDMKTGGEKKNCFKKNKTFFIVFFLQKKKVFK